jgi:sulfotransferase family protein
MGSGQQMVFVGGLHRSGTTPLARALATHPQISGLTGTPAKEDEGQHLQDVYPKIRAYGGMGRFANAPAAHLTEASPLVSTASAARLLAAWSRYWDAEKPYLLEKSPSNIIMARFLQALFPDSHFIMVIRHPVVVALAMQKWNPPLVARNGRRRVSFPGLVAHWVRAHDILRKDADHLRSLHVVRYEDLVSDPERELGQVQQQLGLSAPIPVSGIRAGLSNVYAQQWTAMESGNPLQRWARRRVETRLAAGIARHGYDVHDLDRRTAWPAAD